LLQGLKKKHERVDDLESFFHVLNWVALQYVPNELSAHDLGLYLYYWYDYTPPGNNKGGQMKWVAICCKAMACEVRFHPPSLRTLVKNLEFSFNALYETKPDVKPLERALKKYEKYKNPLTDDAEKLEMLEDASKAFEYVLGRKNLESGTWMIEQFDAALQNMESLTVPGDIVVRSENEIVRYGPSKAQYKRKNPPTSEASGNVAKKPRVDSRTPASQRSQNLPCEE
jgi:hypothetical protein